MQIAPMTWDIPEPFVELALIAARLDASLAVFDDRDQLVYVSVGKRRLYPFIDWSQPQTFDSVLRRSWEQSTAEGIAPRFDTIDAQLADAKQARLVERLEFGRRFPTALICGHVRLPSGWNAQIRVEPHRAGLDAYFSPVNPSLGLQEAIRRREEAEERAAALDCLAFGIAVVGPDRKIRHRNAAMGDLIGRRDGFDLDDLGRLIALDLDNDADLARLVALACMGQLLPVTAALRVRRGGNLGSAHTVSVSRGTAASAVIVVAPAQHHVGTVSTVLQRDFGLTAAEAGLAARIGNGLSNEDASRDLQKSPETGREQIKSILKKLDRGELANRGQTGLARWVAVVGAITGAARLRGK